MRNDIEITQQAELKPIAHIWEVYGRIKGKLFDTLVNRLTDQPRGKNILVTFIVALMGKIFTMPGLPKEPTTHDMNITKENEILGLF